jgi:hypothetical protein
MFKTIAETAQELKVTRQCVYKKLSRLKPELENHITVENGVKLISHKGIEIIKNDINNPVYTKTKKNDNKNEKNNDEKASINNDENNDKRLQFEFVKELYESKIKQMEDTIDYLKQENDNKNKQLENKDRQLESKDKLLENMQVLLKDQQLLIESKNKSKWKFWKKD